MKMRGFGKLKDGRNAGLYILRNASGMEASVTDFGATLVSLVVPDAKGERIDVVLGYGDVSGYEDGQNTYGGTVGRFANRIGNAKFELNGETYELTANNGVNSLHGGRDFYTKRLWQTKIGFSSVSSRDVVAKSGASESMNDGGPAYVQDSPEGDSVTFVLDSPDGDQGYPGNLHLEVTYTITNSGELHIDYRAESDKDTPFNPTNHSYFNLAGHDSGVSIEEHLCKIKAGLYTPNDEGNLPTGELSLVENTPFDFRHAKPIGMDINEDDEQLRFSHGYDHNFCLDGEGYREVAGLYSEMSGIGMEVYTDLPGIQLYTGNGITEEDGKCLFRYKYRMGVALETQFWPDAVNKENFPGGILKAGEKFVSRTTYKFV